VLPAVRRPKLIKVEIVNEVSKIADITKVKAEVLSMRVRRACEPPCSAASASSCAVGVFHG